MSVEQIKQYKIIKRLGTGGMGTVYQAFDTILERHVAIKLMHPHLLENKSTAERFVREAKAAARLSHPNIVTIYEVGEDTAGKYIVMESVTGRPLSTIIRDDEVTPVNTAIRWITQLLAGLSCAHEQGILHRDIKPDNILISDNGRVKILDFGIAKMTMKEGLTAGGDILGTVEYMAPEQMLGENVDSRCDIYAAGVVLYQLLTDHLPFNGETPVAILYKQLNEKPMPPSVYNEGLDKQIEAALEKALAKEPSARWSHADDFAAALNSALVGEKRTIEPFREKIEDLEDLGSDDLPETHSESGEVNAEDVFIGRNRELQKLLTVFEKVGQGNGQTVLIRGEAGVGKTTLLNRLKTRVSGKGDAWFLYGACLYQEGMDPYLPYIDAFRSFFSNDSRSLPDDERFKLKEMVRQEVPLLLEFTERFTTTFGGKPRSGDEADQAPQNLLEGIYFLLDFLSKIKPVVLVLDDIQWADESSLRLFHYLSRQIDKNCIMLIGLSRTDRYDLHKDGKPSHLLDVLARISREGLCKEITLERFDRSHAEQLIDRTLSHTVFSEEFYDTVYRETRGNPFFVLETLKHLREQKKIYWENDAWHDDRNAGDISIPNRIEDVFRRQLSGLTPNDREVLQLASIIGVKFDISLLSQIAEISRIKLLRQLQRIERDLNLLASTDKGLQFEHPMLREILYEEIPAALRKEYHLFIAETLREIYGDDPGSMVQELARHFFLGGDYSNASPLLYKAAVRAYKISAFQEAEHLFADLLGAIDKLDSFPENLSREDIYLKQGVCYEETGLWDEAIAAFRTLHEIALASGEKKFLAEALIHSGRVLDKQGKWEDALKSYETCLELVSEEKMDGYVSHLNNNIGIIYFQKSDWDTAMKYFNRAVGKEQNSANNEYRAHAMITMGVIENMRTNHKIAIDHYQHALELYEEMDMKKSQARVYHNIGITLSDQGSMIASIDSFEKCLDLATALEDKHLRALTHLNMSKAFVRQQNLVEAKGHAEKSLKIFKRLGDELSLAEVYLVFAMIYEARETFPRAEKFLKESIRLNHSKQYREGLAESCFALGRLYLKMKKNDAALKYLNRAEIAYKDLQAADQVEAVKEVKEKLLNPSMPQLIEEVEANE